MEQKIYRVTAMLLLKNGMSIRTVEYDVLGNSPKTFSVKTSLGEGRRIKRENLMQLDSKLNNSSSVIGFFTWCMPEDVRAAEALVRNAVASYLENQESNVKAMREHYNEFVLNSLNS